MAGALNVRPFSSCLMSGSVCSSGQVGPAGIKSVLNEGYQYDES